MILGGIVSYAVDTDFGNVKTMRITLADQDGYRLSANLYIPNGASAQQPHPAMIISPGGDCTADLASPWATELARRGYVVAAVDYTGSGDTQVNPQAQYFSGGAMGLDTVYDYLASCSFVDHTQIGVGGHSMGSLYSYRLALQREVTVVISDVLYTDDMPDYDFNFIEIAAEHDEGILSRIKPFDEIYKDTFLTALFGTEEIEPNKIYGSWEEGNVRVLYPLNQTHQDDMVSGQFIRVMLESVMNSMPAPNPIDAGNMIYGWKIAGLAAAIIGLVIFLFALAGLLLDSRWFDSLKLKAAESHPGFTYGSKAWWIYFAILAIVPLATFFPGTALGNKMASNKLYQLGTTPNGYMVWTLLSTCVLIIVFVVFHMVYGKKHGGCLKSYGYGTSDGKNTFCISYILKSAVFALILFMCGYTMIMLIFHFANTDLHLWTMSLRPLNLEKAATMPWYFLGFLPYFLMFTLAGKGLGMEGRKKMSMTKSVIISTLVGLLGLIALFIVYEILLRFTSVGPFYTGSFAHFYMSLLENVIPSFGVAMALNLYISKKTNSSYAGIFIGAAIIAFGIVSANCLGMIVD